MFGSAPHDTIEISPIALGSMLGLGVAILDSAGLVCEWSGQLTEWLGWARTELLGKTLPVDSQRHPEGILPWLQSSDSRSPSDVAQFSLVTSSQAVESFRIQRCDSQMSGATAWLLLLQPVEVVTAVPPETAPLHVGSLPAQLLASIVDRIPDAIITASPDGQILSWNHGAEATYGFRATEATGQPIDIILPPDGRTDWPGCPIAAEPASVMRGHESLRRRKNGDQLTVSVSASGIYNSEGGLIAIATIERDITARRDRETELESARTQAESANRIKAEFVANISHELRTPMNAILGMIDLARRNAQLPPTVHDYLSTAHDAAESMLELVNDLLDFSRLDAGRLDLRQEPFRLRDVLEKTSQALALRARDRGLMLGCQIGTDVPDELQGDARRLRQVVVNLVGNAIKFTNTGEVMVLVNARNLADGQIVLELSVRDTGIGVPEDLREAIFEPFTQVDSSETRLHHGSGLGLTISRKIVALMGGRIWCEANEGPGTTFFVEVPMEVISASIQLPDSTQALLRDVSVRLFVEHSASRDHLLSVLTAWGMRPLALDANDQAVQILRGEADSGCDLVLADADLKTVGGRPLLLELGQRPLQDNVILLVPPGEMDDIKAQTMHAPGIAGLIEKPVSQSDLLAVLVRALQGASAAGRATWMAPISRVTGSLKVLLAEDTKANQKVVRSILEQRGHTVDVVQNGREAVVLASHGDYDVILMDLRMPIMSGIKAAEQIRQLSDKRRSRVPIVALTADVQEHGREQSLAVGMTEYITKPFIAEELIRVVEASAETGRRRTDATRRSTHVRHSTRKVLPPRRGASQRAAIDVQAALARIGNNERLLKDLARLFLEDVPTLAQELDVAFQQNQTEDALRAAHSIKGLASNFDAFELQESAAELERLLREDRITIARELYDRMLLAMETVCVAIRAELMADEPV